MSGLVGRADELAVLVGALDGLDRAGPSWAQVTGEPGIGKTRLVDELCEIAGARGALVLVGRGAELERDVPFGIVIDALDDYLGSLSNPRVAELCGRRLSVLGRLFPALAGHGPSATRGFQDERYLTYRAVRVLVERLAVPGPLLLVFDDLHWADVASIELVSFLLRRPPEARVLAVLAWRAGQAPELGDALSVAARDLPVAAIGLGGLTEVEVGELVGGASGRSGLRALYRESGGNPFYAHALASAVSRFDTPPAPGVEQDDDEAVPRSVATAVRHEIGLLSAAARRLAQGAAVAGEPFELELAAGCAGMAQDEAAAGLDELIAVGVVRSMRSPRRFAFRHPIVRRAVYYSAGPGWRRGAHARAASVLSERGAPVVTRAHHVAHSAASGDLAAAELLIGAAEEVVSRAPPSAATWLAAASAIVPDRAETAGTRLALLSAQARVCGLLGELDGARAALAQALGLVPVGDPRHVGLVAGAAGVEHGLGRFPEARARLLAALEELPSVQGAAEASLCLELAVSWLYTLDFVQATAWATRALRSAQSADRLLEGTARGLLAFVCASAESAEGNEAARAHRAQAAAILDGLGDDEVARRLDALYYLGWAERLLENYPASCAHLGRAVAVAENGGGSQWLIPTMVERVKVLGCCGQLSEARELAATAVEMARSSRVGLLLLLALSAQVAVLGSAGEIEAALASGREALSLASHGAGYHAAGVRRQLALAHLERGDADRFLAALSGLEAGSQEVVRDGVACRLLEARAGAELALGQGETAAKLAKQAQELATALGSPASAGFAARARARVLALTDPERALALTGDAVARFERAGARVEAARTRALRGEILVACGRLSEAFAELSLARAALSAGGAKVSALRASLALRRIRRAGGTAVRAGRVLRGVGALSPREREIAELVADGLGNREIAARLSLSENTVETHLGHILAKLELTARAGVARAISATGPPSAADE